MGSCEHLTVFLSNNAKVKMHKGKPSNRSNGCHTGI